MAQTTYSKAVEEGYPFIRGEGKVVDCVWLNHYTKTDDPSSPGIYIGWDNSEHKFVIEREVK